MEVFITSSHCFADMTRPRVSRGSIPLQKKSKGIILNEDATASRAKETKLPTYARKEKGKGKKFISNMETIPQGSYVPF